MAKPRPYRRPRGPRPTPAILLAHPPTDPNVVRYEAKGPATGTCQCLHLQWTGAVFCMNADRTEIVTIDMNVRY